MIFGKLKLNNLYIQIHLFLYHIPSLEKILPKNRGALVPPSVPPALRIMVSSSKVSGNKGVEKDNIVTQQGMKSVSSVSLQTVEFWIVILGHF